MVHKHAYVACVALGAKDTHAVKALVEADRYSGPSLIIAYRPCIAHGYELVHGEAHQKQAVEVGYWPLCRFDPRRIAEDSNPLQLDLTPPHGEMAAYLRWEGRFRTIERQNPERFSALLEVAQRDANARYALYQHLAGHAPYAQGSRNGGKRSYAS